MILESRTMRANDGRDDGGFDANEGEGSVEPTVGDARADLAREGPGLGVLALVCLAAIVFSVAGTYLYYLQPLGAR
jgi:hypothetical protein